MSSHSANDLPPLGTVVRPAPDGDLLVESNGEPVDPGTRCASEAGDLAGTVEDVIGPVDRPFLVVSLSEGSGEGGREELTGVQLYPR